MQMILIMLQLAFIYNSFENIDSNFQRIAHEGQLEVILKSLDKEFVCFIF